MTKRYTLLKIMMTCNNCGYKRMQCLRTPCHKCREGMMTHNHAGRIRIPVSDDARKPEAGK